MPRLSEFFGIAIYLYWGETGQHHAPHFHAQYGGGEAVFSIPDAEVLAGAGARPPGSPGAGLCRAEGRGAGTGVGPGREQ